MLLQALLRGKVPATQRCVEFVCVCVCACVWVCVCVCVSDAVQLTFPELALEGPRGRFWCELLTASGAEVAEVSHVQFSAWLPRMLFLVACRLRCNLCFMLQSGAA